MQAAASADLRSHREAWIRAASAPASSPASVTLRAAGHAVIQLRLRRILPKSGQHSLLHGGRTMALKAAVKRKVPKSCIPVAPSKRRRCAASEPATFEGGHVTYRQKDGKKPATKEQPDHVPPASIRSLISKVIGVEGLKFQGFMTCRNGTPGCTMTTLKIL
ncbi:hypothetical protein ACP70R_000098 [Stipagrostis hirtigluma subsp. patula]